MAHPETEALDVRPLDTADDAATRLDAFFAQEDGDEPEPDEDSAEEEAPEGDEPEEDEQDDEDDEPETVIDAPVSLNAEEKAVFAQLPKEAQQAWSASETRRNAQVQEATTKAANAERQANEARATAAQEASAQAKSVYAIQLAQWAEKYKPQEPSYELARVNPAEYIAQRAQYDFLQAQYDNDMQQAESLWAEAEKETASLEDGQRVRDLLSVPELASDDTRGEFLARAYEAAELLGYPTSLVDEQASGMDVKALATAHGWKAKADKYDALISKQMTRVRDFKTAKPNAAQPLGSGKARAQVKTQQRLRDTGDIRDAAAAIAALG